MTTSYFIDGQPVHVEWLPEAYVTDEGVVGTWFATGPCQGAWGDGDTADDAVCELAVVMAAMEGTV